MDVKKKPRSSNIELLRIVAMFMIILFHITCHCITVQLANADTPMVSYFTQPVFHKRLFILDWLNTLGIVSNAIFILISGYFMANRKSSEINLGRISKKLLLQLGFAALLLVCIPPLVHVVKPMSYMNMQGISIFNGMSWFVGYYFIVITCGALFFNTFLSKLDYEKFSAFLLVLFALIQFSWSRGRIEALAAGLGTVLTGLLLYAIGGFIKRFEPFQKIKSSVFIGVIALLNGLVLLSGYNLVESKIIAYIRQGLDKPLIPAIPGYDNTSVIIILIAICLFELFCRISLPEIRLINYLGKATFMIYLLHDNNLFYGLWNHRNWIATLAESSGMFIFHLLKWASFTFLLGVLAYGVYNLALNLLQQHKHIFLRENIKD